MPDPTLSDAVKEAYATAPADVVVLDTLSLQHPDWLDSDNNAMALYFVRDHADLTATIESTATIDAGQSVTFKGTAFEIELPLVESVPVPEITIHIDNVGGDLMPYVDAALASKDKITLIYRPYLSTDTSAPQMIPPLSLILSTITITTFRLTARARMLDIGNRAFPRQDYNTTDFPGLANF